MISSNSSLPTDPIESVPFVVSCTLSSGKYQKQSKALIDTGATGYAFIDESTAHSVCELLDISPVALQKPKALRGFDGKLVPSITHAIYPTLQVQDHIETTCPLLITNLGQHPIILGKPWLNRHGVLLDMKTNELIFIPERCSHYGAPTKKNSTYLDGITQMDPAGSRAVRPLHQNGTQPGSQVGGQLRRQVTSILPRSTTEVPEQTSKPIEVKRQYKGSTPEQTTGNHSIAQIGAAAFRSLSRQPNTKLFSMSMAELQLATIPVEISEIEPLEQDLQKLVPREYHDFLDVFDKQAANELPPHRSYDHKIELEPHTTPPKSKLYPMSQYKLEKAKQYIEENLKKGFITPSNAAYSSPILFAAKANGDLRFCVDYRKLNALTKKDRYPLPLIDETLARLAGCKFITKFDIIAAFNKLRMHRDSEDYTTFTTAMGAYKYLVLPFGLTGGPASFQHYINDTLLPFLNDFVQAYLDDIIIYSKTRKEHTEHVRRVLAKLREAGLQVDIRKSEFYVQETTFLGLLVSTEGLKINPEKVAAVVDWPAPTNLRQMQSFIGFCNFYRRFIRDFSKIARPLTRLARKDVPFQWDSACQESFIELKKQITSAPVLRHFDRTRESFLETDSSDYVSGGVLSQKDDEGRLHPVAFYSKNLLPAECNYEIYDKELLAIIKCFEHWRPELEFTKIPIQVFSDHASLKHFMTTKVLTRRQARWAEILSEYNFIINIRPGTQNGKADALTRLPGSSPQDDIDERKRFQEQTLLPQTRFSIDCAETRSQSISLFERIKQANIEDPQCHEIRAAKARGQNKFEGISLEHCLEEDGALYWKEALWVPQDNQTFLDILQEVHNLPSGGHKGVVKTIDLIKRYYYWPGMRESIKRYIRNCYECHRAKAPTDQKNGLLQPLPIPQQRWLDISLDFITGLPKTMNGNNAILNVIDRLSKERHYIACVSGDEGTSTEETLNMLIDHVYKLHGAPASIVSDRGPQFVSALWKSFNKRLGTQMNLSTAFHPETDGQTREPIRILRYSFEHIHVKTRMTGTVGSQWPSSRITTLSPQLLASHRSLSIRVFTLESHLDQIPPIQHQQEKGFKPPPLRQSQTRWTIYCNSLKPMRL